MIAPQLSRGYQKLGLGALIVSLFYLLYTNFSFTSFRLSQPHLATPISNTHTSDHVPAVVSDELEPSGGASSKEEEHLAELQTPNHLSDGSVDGVIVMGKMAAEDAAWLERLPHWQHAVYSVDNNTAPLHTSINKGREAMPYLTYIIDHYNRLPKNLVFLHAHEEGYPVAWHTDTPEHSNIWSVEHLNLDFLQRNGYANLRCIYIPGCPDEIQPFRDDKEVDRTPERVFADAWKVFFGNDNVPEVIGAPCCAQFAVSREQVRKRSLRDYLRFRQWLYETELSDEISGRVFEYMWHIIFGQEPV